MERHRARLGRVAWAAALAVLVAHGVHGLVAGESGWVHVLFNDGVYNGILGFAAAACAFRAATSSADRFAWIAFSAALLFWFLGETADTVAFYVWPDLPYPHVPEGLLIAFYPAAYAGIVLLLRARARELGFSIWLDGIIAAGAAGAIGAAAFFPLVVEASGAPTLDVAINLGYPLGDAILFGLVVGALLLGGRRAGPEWALIGLSLAVAAAADGIFLYVAARGEYTEATLLDTLWPASALLLAAAAAARPKRPQRIELDGRVLFLVPAIAAVGAIGVLTIDQWRHVNAVAIGLAVLTLFVVVVRAMMSFRENRVMLRVIRMQAVTDELTGLGNRRKLLDDLESTFAEPAGGGDPLLLLFDLDGFKRYNDTFGHPAGDTLLVRLGGKLREAVGRSGEAYRLGGDEFCVLAHLDAGRTGQLIDASTAALSEAGEGFSVRASFGAAFLGDEASSPAAALKLADQRLYAQKHGKSLSAAIKPEDVLLRVLQESEPTLRERSRAVSVLAVAIGERLAMRPSELADLARAAELHDIGKLGIPDAILHKRDELDAYEREFLCRHSTIGERILSATPALANAARIVRSTHERWDGTGYPDKLAGEDIPLASRIIAVCDAFVAMTSERAHRLVMSGDVALGEIRRCAGTQFDPAVVDAFFTLISSAPGHGTTLGHVGRPLGEASERF